MATATKSKSKSESKLTQQRNAKSLSPISLVWEWYTEFAQSNQLALTVLDETLSRLLFWIPHHNHNAKNNDDHSDSRNGALNDGTGIKPTETKSSTTGVGASSNDEFGTSLEAAWREVGYGILSLHRLSMHLALTGKPSSRLNGHGIDINGTSSTTALGRNHYGMSIRTKHPPSINATSVRIGLAVIHSLLPALLSLLVVRTRAGSNHERLHLKSHNNNNNNNNIIVAEASRARLVLEQAKFFLRMYLLVHYWRQQKTQSEESKLSQDTTRTTTTTTTTAAKKQPVAPLPDFGIMLDGGLYHSDQHQESIGIPYHHAMALQRRRDYVGERTGWNVVCNSHEESKRGIWSYYASKILQRIGVDNGCDNNWRNAKTVVAEVLYIVRPLLWAWFESRYHARRLTSTARRYNTNTNNKTATTASSTAIATGTASMTTTIRQDVGAPAPAISNWNYKKNATNTMCHHQRPSLWKGWLICLVMDVLSIRLLHHHHHPPRKSSCSRRGPYSTTPPPAAAAAASTTNVVDIDPFREEEVKRRKLRLLLYLLRAPVWSSHTLPAIEQGFAAGGFLRKLPVVGNLLETIVWDWILYYQHPFVAEEG